MEEPLNLGGRLRIATRSPLELEIGHDGIGFRRGGGGGRGPRGGLTGQPHPASQQVVGRRGQDGVGWDGLALAKEFLGFLGRNDFAHGDEKVRVKVRVKGTSVVLGSRGHSGGV